MEIFFGGVLLLWLLVVLSEADALRFRRKSPALPELLLVELLRLGPPEVSLTNSSSSSSSRRRFSDNRSGGDWAVGDGVMLVGSVDNRGVSCFSDFFRSGACSGCVISIVSSSSSSG